jgi:fermentation-respiration switch protein FrsA (DUF1100 family)
MRDSVVATFLVLALALALLWAGQRRMIYFPFGTVPSPASVGLDRAEEVTFTTEDGLTLHGWFVPADSTPVRFTVIVFNGNAGHRAMRAPLAAALARHGVASLLFDYRGYGDNAGAPSEAGLVRDAHAVRAYLAGRPDVDASRLVYFGESLGAAVALRLATEASPHALVLRSPFTSLADIGRHHYPFLPVGLLLRDRYPSLDFVPRLTCPTLVIAGDRDGIIPIEQSRRLYAAAPEPKHMVTIEGADHNDDALLAGTRLIESVIAFVPDAGRRAP